MIEQLI
jgi:hypothetical protein